MEGLVIAFFLSVCHGTAVSVAPLLSALGEHGTGPGDHLVLQHEVLDLVSRGSCRRRCRARMSSFWTRSSNCVCYEDQSIRTIVATLWLGGLGLYSGR